MDCFGEDYQTKFDSQAFLDTVFRVLKDPWKKVLMEWNDEFTSPDHKGGKMLDIGSGPSIHLAMLGSKVYNDITLSDFSDSNRQELFKWVNDENNAFDWKEFLAYIGKLEKRNPQIISERTRSKIAEIIPINLVDDNIFHPNIRGRYDCVVGSFILEACYKDMQSYKDGFKKIAEHVVEGGILVLFGPIGETYYQVGRHRFHAFTVHKADLEVAAVEAGFVIKKMKIFDVKHLKTLPCDSEGVYFLSARKVSK